MIQEYDLLRGVVSAMEQWETCRKLVKAANSATTFEASKEL